jgi:hypothetical protein
VGLAGTVARLARDAQLGDRALVADHVAAGAADRVRRAEVVKPSAATHVSSMRTNTFQNDVTFLTDLTDLTVLTSAVAMTFSPSHDAVSC